MVIRMPKKARSRPEPEKKKSEFATYVESKTGRHHGIYQKDLAAAIGVTPGAFSIKMSNGSIRFEEMRIVFHMLGSTKEEIWDLMK